MLGGRQCSSAQLQCRQRRLGGAVSERCDVLLWRQRRRRGVGSVDKQRDGDAEAMRGRCAARLAELHLPLLGDEPADSPGLAAHQHRRWRNVHRRPRCDRQARRHIREPSAERCVRPALHHLTARVHRHGRRVMQPLSRRHVVSWRQRSASVSCVFHREPGPRFSGRVQLQRRLHLAQSWVLRAVSRQHVVSGRQRDLSVPDQHSLARGQLASQCVSRLLVAENRQAQQSLSRLRRTTLSWSSSCVAIWPASTGRA